MCGIDYDNDDSIFFRFFFHNIDASATPATTTGFDLSLQMQWMEASAVIQPNPCLDVFYSRILGADSALRQLLHNKMEAIARKNPDRPIPQCLNFFDPNLNVSRQRLSFLDPTAVAISEESAIQKKDGGNQHEHHPEGKKKSSDSSLSAACPGSHRQSRPFDRTNGLLFGSRDAPFHPQWIATDVLVTAEDVDMAMDGVGRGVGATTGLNVSSLYASPARVQSSTSQGGKMQTPVKRPPPLAISTGSESSKSGTFKDKSPVIPSPQISPQIGSLSWIERMSAMSPSSRALASVGIVRTAEDSDDSSSVDSPGSGRKTTPASLRQQVGQRIAEKALMHPNPSPAATNLLLSASVTPILPVGSSPHDIGAVVGDESHNAQLPGRTRRVDSEDPTTKVLRAHIASKVHNLPPGKNVALYITIEKVLTTALPLLARLRRPALLFPGPMQVVIKSQRMLLEEYHAQHPKEDAEPASDAVPSDNSHYSGVWHIDGKHEHIVAVVLYYFEKVNVVGGDLEFTEKSLPHPVRLGALPRA